MHRYFCIASALVLCWTTAGISQQIWPYVEPDTVKSPAVAQTIEPFQPAELKAPLAPTRTVSDVLYRGLNKFVGKSPKYAFDRIGYPDSKMIIEGDVVYRWSNTTSNTNGGILTCTVKIGVRKGLIVNTDFNGNNGACEQYAIGVDPTFKGIR